MAFPYWESTIAPSLIHRLILLGLGSASALAILISELAAPAQLACLLIIAAWVRHLYRKLNRNRILRHHGGPDDTLNHWTLVNGPADCVEGMLVHKGYRSAGLLILAIRETDSDKIHHIPIWRDSVSAMNYSYLTLQLLFNTADASDNPEATRSGFTNSHLS